MKIKSLLLIGSMAVFGMAMTSCSKEENLFDSDAAQAQRMEKYKANFEKAFGTIDPDQNWDFASMEPVYLPVSYRNATTRSASVVTRGEDGQIIIDQPVLTWMHNNMSPGNDNSTKGKKFSFEAPSNPITIVPIYQGIASYFWELWMDVDGTPYKVWEKGKDISYRTSSESSTWKTPDNNGVPDDAYEVKAPTATYTFTAGAEMFFYLKVWGSKAARDKNPAGGTVLTSLSKKMLALKNAPVPAAIAADSEYKALIIGCEDGADNDFEDLVFMVYGKPVPTIIFHKDVKVVEAKRYMIEDLGGDDDFDFNDIVVDVQRYKTVRDEYAGEDEESAEVVNSSVVAGSIGQRAILRAAGGTLNFTLKIGATSWSKSQLGDYTQMLNTGWQGNPIDYEAELAEIKLNDNDWDADQNNISVDVEGSNGINTLVFPKRGEAPTIISVEPATMEPWMKERKRIPTSWLSEVW